jgi:hypothetical protein
MAEVVKRASTGTWEVCLFMRLFYNVEEVSLRS